MSGVGVVVCGVSRPLGVSTSGGLGRGLGLEISSIFSSSIGMSSRALPALSLTEHKKNVEPRAKLAGDLEHFAMVLIPGR